MMNGAAYPSALVITVVGKSTTPGMNAGVSAA
jgi:hypothetical protein